MPSQSQVQPGFDIESQPSTDDEVISLPKGKLFHKYIMGHRTCLLHFHRPRKSDKLFCFVYCPLVSQILERFPTMVE